MGDSPNVALVKRIYDLFNRLPTDRDKRLGSPVETEVLSLFAEDVDLMQPDGALVESSAGREAFRSVWDEWLSAWEYHRSTVERIEENGKRVLVVSRDRFEGRGGLQLEHVMQAVFTIEDGIVTHMQGFFDDSEAAEAALRA